MSQHDLDIANQSAPAIRADLNLALLALASQSSGASAPVSPIANMIWYDTANDTLKMRSEANDAWISLGVLNQSTNVFEVVGLDDLSTEAYVDARTPVIQLSRTTISADATVELTLDTATYTRFQIVIDGVIPATDAVQFLIRLSNDAGSTFEAGAAYYQYGFSSTAGNNTGTNATFMLVGDTNTVGSAAGESGVSAKLDVLSAGAAGAKTRILGTHTAINSSGQLASGVFTGLNNTAEANDAIQFLFSSGNLESGTITLYGVK